MLTYDGEMKEADLKEFVAGSRLPYIIEFSDEVSSTNASLILSIFCLNYIDL